MEVSFRVTADILDDEGRPKGQIETRENFEVLVDEKAVFERMDFYRKQFKEVMEAKNIPITNVMVRVVYGT